MCTVVEQGTGTFPPGSVVTYSPPGAASPGVTITSDTATTVTINNDFSGLVVQTESSRSPRSWCCRLRRVSPCPPATPPTSPAMTVPTPR